MMKMSACVIVLLAGYLFGYLKGQDLVTREKTLTDFILSLKIIKSDIQYGEEPLPEIIEKLLNQDLGRVQDFYSVLAERLKNDKRATFSKLWEESLEQWKASRRSILEEDCIILKSLAHKLGATDIEGQTTLLEGIINRLEFQKERALKDIEEKRRMYRWLGLSTAVGLLVFLV